MPLMGFDYWTEANDMWSVATCNLAAACELSIGVDRNIAIVFRT